MTLRLPHIPYPPSRPEEGFWGPVTSTINWCEEDFYATIYSAEIVNTLTNLLFVYLGVKGIRNCLKYDHDGVFLVAFIGYLLVGLGSFGFHSVLMYNALLYFLRKTRQTDILPDPMQLVDELNMIYTACLMNYASWSFGRSKPTRLILGAGFVSLAIFITAYYHYLQDPDFHQNAFAILTAVLLFRSVYLMEVNLRPSLRARWGTIQRAIDPTSLTQFERAAQAERDQAILITLWSMMATGLGIFLCGFGIWTLDNQYCSTFRRWRHRVGLPWGVLLEGHGWWHILTGYATYEFLIWAIYLRHCLNERQDEFVLRWPSYFSIPEVVPRPVAEKSPGYWIASYGESNKPANGHANEHANGRPEGNESTYPNGKANGYSNGHVRDRKSV